MKLLLLRTMLMLDAAVLFLLGALLLFAPRQVEVLFHFNNLPPAVSYLLGLWGCCLASLGVGYLIAATNPLRYLAWVKVGIARGALECALGILYALRGVVTWQQASLGIALAAFVAAAYYALYPRQPRLAPTLPGQPAAPAASR